MTKTPKTTKKTKQENLDEIFERLGKPSNGLDIELFRTRLFDLMKYYNWCLENSKSETRWNDDRKCIERIAKIVAELKEAIQNASPGALSHINIASQLSSDETLRNPFKANILIFDGSRDLAVLDAIEDACDKSIELFGGKHRSRPKSIGIKVRVICYIANLFHEFYIENSKKTKAPRISAYDESSFYELVKGLLPDDFDITYSIVAAKKRYNDYLAGDTSWWINNTKKMSTNSMEFGGLIENGYVPAGEKEVNLVYSHDMKKLKLDL